LGSGDSVFPEAALDYVPRVVGELHMVCDAHLFILQIHTSSFAAGQWGEIHKKVLTERETSLLDQASVRLLDLLLDQFVHFF
jgi:hypothetical protein